ncbi:murein biosynthesis integral membrane protein MurJ [uncultured Williamsia sp.]|uniref:murein biosynthesis integral membrane protein MurJ n=1 Tax=uncultured Williamsia sp. TaxID=259311 RepID=UPI002623B039|nr:murein biosynthesis integral membrane protein MurJ [uncultured Williamsia sp.]
MTHPSGPIPPPSGPLSRRPAAAVAVTTQTEALDDTVDPTPAAGRDQPSDESVLRTSGSIAFATLTSRITGFVRTVLVLAMLGPAVASAFQAAYVLPSIVAEVVLGAVLTAIVIPVLVRAENEDADGGEGFINRIFTLALTMLGAATVVALVCAPLLTYLNLGDGEVNRPLATALAYLLLPEVLFYGLSALFIAILNMKGAFRPGAWAPVWNNVVQISTLVAYYLVPGDISLNPVRMGDAKLLVLGLGTTLGVVLQAFILLPALRRAGVRLRLRWGLDDRLRSFGRMAGAIVLYVAVLQVGFFITYRIASGADSSGVSVYATHWQLLQLPYGVLGVTILTAIMPRLSRNAAANDTHSVVDDLSLSTRLTMVALVPVITFMTFFGPAIAIAIFDVGKFDLDAADQLGMVLSFGAFTIIPYSMTLVQLRVFYAREDAWTPTAIAVGITVVKVAASYLGPVLFDDGHMIVRWLAFSNGLGYFVGAVVGHFLLRHRLGTMRMTNVARTTIATLAASVVGCGVVWGVAHVSGLARLSDDHGKIASLGYLVLVAVVALGLVYTSLVLLRIPDVIAVSVAVRRMLGRVIPAVAPRAEPPGESVAEMTVQFPRITGEESTPYSGQVQVMRRFDSGTSRWQAYSDYTGGAVGQRPGGGPLRPGGTPPDMRYRRRGVGFVGEGSDAGRTGVDRPGGDDPGSRPDATPPAGGGVHDLPGAVHTDPRLSALRPDGTPRSDAPVEEPADTPSPTAPTDAGPTDAASPGLRRGPRLVPGAAVAGGRYRLLSAHGGARGLRFWRARDINLDRDVALTFVDADQTAPSPAAGEAVGSRGEGPQAVLSRTLRLGRVNAPGIARVLDVVRGSSGGIVVSEWVAGSSLAEVARTNPSPIGAARAVRALAAAAESAHRTGSSLSIDHPDRIRISREGNAVLAFPGTLAGDDKSTDVRGLGAVLYALLLAHWPLDPTDVSKNATTDTVDEPIGGLEPAVPSAAGGPAEPRAQRPDVPFEISAVAARALEGNSGIRTAATIQHVLDQATVVDQKTDLMPVVGPDGARPTPTSNVAPGSSSSRFSVRDMSSRSKRVLAVSAGAALLILLVIVALVVWLSDAVGPDTTPTDINSIITSSESAAPSGSQPATGTAAAAVPLRSVTVVDYSRQTPDSSANVGNVITGQDPPWRTDLYRGGPRFGNLKPGLGLMIALQNPAAVRTVTVRTPNPGLSLQIRTSPSADASFDSTVPVAAMTVGQPTTTVTVDQPRQSPYILVWLTELPQSGRGYQGVISQISMTT